MKQGNILQQRQMMLQSHFNPVGSLDKTIDDIGDAILRVLDSLVGFFFGWMIEEDE